MADQQIHSIAHATFAPSWRDQWEDQVLGVHTKRQPAFHPDATHLELSIEALGPPATSRTWLCRCRKATWLECPVGGGIANRHRPRSSLAG